MKRLPYNFLALLLAAVMFSSCASKKVEVSSRLNFAQQNQFDQLYFKASKQKVLGNYVEAAKLFIDALKIDPQSHAAMYQMGNLSIAVTNYHDAVYWSEKAMLTNPDYNYWYAGQLAQSYNKVGEFMKSAQIFEVMMDQEPDKRRNYEEASRQYINAGEFKKATGILEDYVKRFGLNEDVARMLEGLAYQQRKPKDAIAWMKKLVETNPTDIRYQGLLAESYGRNNQFDEAKAIYLSILRQEPGNGYANFGLSEIYQKTKQEDSSFHYLLTAFNDERVPLEMKMKVVGSYFPLLQREKMRAQALQLTQRLVEVHDKEEKAFIAHGDVLHAAGKMNEARNSLLKATEINPGDITVWRKLLSIDDELKNFEWLQIDSKNALEMFPNQPFLYIINAFAAFTNEDYTGAKTVAEEGLEIALLKNDKTDLLSTIGDASYELKDYKSCFEAYEELLELDAANDGALNNYAYYLSEQNQQLERALEMIDRALAINPTRATYIDTKGWILFMLERYDEALPLLKEAYNLIPNDEEIAEHYAQCLAKLNKLDEAQKVRDDINKTN